MFNQKKYGYVVVKMDKRDYALENLEEDLINWTEHLYKSIETKENLIYRGLCPIKEIEHLKLLCAVSPYGSGYEITVDNYDLNDLRLNKRFRVS